MKLKLNLAALVVFSIIFTSCSNDVIVTSDPSAEYFEYTANNFPITSASCISAGDENTLFVSAVNGGWKITNGNAERIDFQDADFRTYFVEASENNYAVFSGTTGITGPTNYFKIYDNGTVRTVSAPVNSSMLVYLLQKNEFITSSVNKYNFFKDSSFTEFTLPVGQSLYKAGRVNNENYIVTDDGNGVAYTYKHTLSGPVLLFATPTGVIFNVNENLYRVQPLVSNQYFLYYLTGKEGWNQIYVSNLTEYEMPRKIIGSSINFLVEIGEEQRNDSKVILIKIWNGTSFLKQANFPDYIFPSSETNQAMVSQYKNNSFYLYRNMGDGGRVIKAKLKAQQ